MHILELDDSEQASLMAAIDMVVANLGAQLGQAGAQAVPDASASLAQWHALWRKVASAAPVAPEATLEEPGGV